MTIDPEKLWQKVLQRPKGMHPGKAFIEAYEAAKTMREIRPDDHIGEVNKMVWQPIETAPKDGTPILVMAKRLGWPKAKPARVMAAYYMNQWRIYGAAQGEPKSGTVNEIQSVQWLDEVNPISWIPAPTTRAEVKES